MANEEVKLILFDDGSTDDTWEYILRITADDPNTKGFQSKHRTGHTILYDNGFSIANTDYIGVLHADMPLRVTPCIIIVDPLTDCDPTVTHSDIAATGVVEAKVKSISSCTRSNTATNYGV